MHPTEPSKQNMLESSHVEPTERNVWRSFLSVLQAAIESVSCTVFALCLFTTLWLLKPLSVVPKTGGSNSTGKENRKVMRIIELKKEIIAILVNCVCVSDLATRYNMAKSTILSFLKNREAINEANVTK